MGTIRQLLVFGVALTAFAPHPAIAQTVTKPAVPGVTNFSKLETTIACAGATTPEAVPALKEMGYKSIINLRLATEAGANVEGEAAAAKAAGINYVHIPFNTTQPDPAVADAFVAAVTKPENNPAFVHCASANRAAAHVDDQADGRGQVGRGESRHGSRFAWSDQRRAQDVRCRVRDDASALARSAQP